MPRTDPDRRTVHVRAAHAAALVCALLGLQLLAAPLYAVELEPYLTSRIFVPVTDSAAGNYQIGAFRMNADATVAIFVVRLLDEDPRGCTTRQQLRIVDLWQLQESVIHTGFTYDTGVGNPCRSSLEQQALDVSDDGTRVVYVRMQNRDPDPPLPEIVVYDVETGSEQILLRELPFSNFGNPTTRRIDPAGSDPAPFSLSGDGDWLWFVNRLGPWGPPGSSGDPGPSGNTLYRVSVPGALATAELEDRQLPLPGLHPNATSLVSNGRFPVSTDGTVALVSAGNLFSAPFTPALLAVRAGEGAGVVHHNPTKGLIGGHWMSGDASRVVFGNRGDAVAGEPERLLVLDLDENLVPTEPQVLDPDVTTSSPRLSDDGVWVLYWEGQRESVRWAHTTPGLFMREINQPAVEVWSSRVEISADGLVHLVHGSAKSDGPDISELPRDLLLSFWSDPNDAALLGDGFDDVPFAHWAAGGPALCYHRDPQLTPAMINTYQYYTVGEVSSAFSYGFDASGRTVVRNGLAGLNDTGDLRDDGQTERDEVANDGVYTDTALWLNDGLYPEDDVVYVRLGLANAQGLASHHDVTARVLEAHDARRREWITTSGKLEWTFADTGVTLILEEPGTANGFLAAQSFQGLPPEPAPPAVTDLTGAAAGYWRIVEGPQLQTSPVLARPEARGRLEFQFSEADLVAADLEREEISLFLSLDCGRTWVEVDSEVEPVAPIIRTRNPRSSWGGHWAIAERGILDPTIFADDFEIGTLASWSSVVQ